MNRNLLITLIASAVFVSACGGGSSDAASVGSAGAPAAQDTSLAAVAADGTTSIDASSLAARLTTVAPAPLSAAETASLLWMREEEKLAQNVYAASYARWGTLIFNNVAASETTHTSAVKTLLDRYGLADPAAGKAAGAFTNTTLQGLYDTFAARSQASVVDALLVGAEIEDLDIHDLETQKATVDNADILLVYDNLLAGSRNHLRAFARELARYSVTYTPRYITQAAYDAIVASNTERGGNR